LRKTAGTPHYAGRIHLGIRFAFHFRQIKPIFASVESATKAGKAPQGEGVSVMAAVVTLTIKNGKATGKKYAFDGPGTCLIGRATNCYVCLPNHPEFFTVSRNHCMVRIDGEEVLVRDCGSHNGTFLNGMQIGRPLCWHFPAEVAALPCRDYDLVNGDEIRVGDTVFIVGMSHTPQGRAANPFRADQSCKNGNAVDCRLDSRRCGGREAFAQIEIHAGHR
jgi:hypothetical protein